MELCQASDGRSSSRGQPLEEILHNFAVLVPGRHGILVEKMAELGYNVGENGCLEGARMAEVLETLEGPERSGIPEMIYF